MKKIPTLFLRDFDKPGHPVTDVVNPECAWVFDDPTNVTARVKIDGTCMMRAEDGDWWARREVKPGKKWPEGYRIIETDEVTGKTVCWEPAGQSPFAKFLTEALAAGDGGEPGTYELVGPKINGNPKRTNRHALISHDSHDAGMRSTAYVWADLTGPAEVRWAVLAMGRDGHEGIVFTHTDGRRAKIKARDFPKES